MLPTLFISHGAPSLALEPGRTGPALQRIGQRWPHPKAILIVSPHWMTSGLRISARRQQQALHDFSGFSPELHRLGYPAPGAPELAAELQQMLRQAGLDATLDEERRLDHGAWVPLRWMYPQADIPVLQLSLPDWPAAQQLALGQALRPLRQQGVLIIGSGSLTHNLHEFFQHYRHLPMQAGSEVYAEEFREWIMARLQARDVSALLDYRRQAPHAARAHPTEEHFMPLFVAWGACDVEVAQVERLNDEMSYRILALDAFAFNEGETV